MIKTLIKIMKDVDKGMKKFGEKKIIHSSDFKVNHSSSGRQQIQTEKYQCYWFVVCVHVQY